MRDKLRSYYFDRFQDFVIDHLNDSFHFKNCSQESLIRTYAYTGEYTSDLVRKIKDLKLLEDIRRRMKAQEDFFDIVKRFNFFELKTLPLKYENSKIFQKGIDVMMAVDLVYHAFNNNYDVVILCSGDIDLKEAVKLVKSLGKKVVVISHSRLSSGELIKESDLFINTAKFTSEELNKFSKVKNKR